MQPEASLEIAYMVGSNLVQPESEANLPSILNALYRVISTLSPPSGSVHTANPDLEPSRDLDLIPAVHSKQPAKGAA